MAAQSPAKGSFTSTDSGVKGLRVRRAMRVAGAPPGTTPTGTTKIRENNVQLSNKLYMFYMLYLSQKQVFLLYLGYLY